MKRLGFIEAPKQEATSVKTVYTTWTISVKWFPEDSIANRVVNKVLNEVGIDMVLTLIWENWTFRLDRKSMMIGTNGYYDYWLCQLNYQYHKDFIDSKDFKDWEKQTEYCIWVWNDAVKKNKLSTTFYAYKTRNAHKDRIIYN